MRNAIDPDAMVGPIFEKYSKILACTMILFGITKMRSFWGVIAKTRIWDRLERRVVLVRRLVTAPVRFLSCLFFLMQNSNSNNTGPKTFLIMPVQQIPKYVILLQRLLNIPRNLIPFESLERALKMFRDTNRDFDTKISRARNQKQDHVCKSSRTSSGRQVDFSAPPRLFL